MQFSKMSPPKSGESSEKSSGENRVKSCHVCGCHGFFGPDNAVFTAANLQASPALNKMRGSEKSSWHGSSNLDELSGGLTG